MNTVHSFKFSGDDQSSSRRGWLAAPLHEESPSLSPEINRLLSAAVVSAAFRRLLLSDPVAALAGGYSGESFEIQDEELAQIILIRAGTLAEFAGELIDRLWFGRWDADDDPVHRRLSRTDPAYDAGKEPALMVAPSARDGRAAQAATCGRSAYPAEGRQWIRHYVD